MTIEDFSGESGPGFKYIGAAGDEIQIPDARSFVREVRAHRIKRATLVYDPHTGHWTQAGTLAMWRVAQAAEPEPGVRLEPPARDAETGSPGAILTPPIDDEPIDRISPSYRSHLWPGKLFVGLNFFAATAFAVMFTLVLPFLVFFSGRDIEFLPIPETSRAIAFGSGFIVLVAIPALLGWGIHSFRRWGWWLTMLVLTLVVLGSGIPWLFPELSLGARISALIPAILAILWMRYFWRRRQDFQDSTPGSPNPIKAEIPSTPR